MLVAIGQENAFPWIERDIGLAFDEWDMPVLDRTTLQSSLPHVLFGGDAALGPENIIWAVAHGHEAAISIDKVHARPKTCANDRRRAPTSCRKKMGIHEWSYDNDVSNDVRYKVPLKDLKQALRNIKVEVELGYDQKLALAEAERCLNCDVQTVFIDNLCIECDACTDICPVDCINFLDNGEEDDLRARLRVPATDREQDYLCLRQSQHRTRDGQGRGCVPALRTVCRTLPDRGVGHAEVLPRDRAGRPGMPDRI